MNKKGFLFIALLSFVLFPATFAFTSLVDCNIRNSQIENYFFPSQHPYHYFAISRNLYFEITPEKLKIWAYNYTKNTFSEPIEILFINAESKTIFGSEETDIEYRFYSGNNPANWVIDSNVCSKVCIPDVYRGIDLEFYFKGHELEFDFIINPQADKDQITLKINNDAYSFTDGDVLTIINEDGYDFNFSIPEIYQPALKNQPTGQKAYAQFTSLDSNTYQIITNDYDKNHELIIDPILTLSTYLLFPSTNQPESLYDKICLDYFDNTTDIAVLGVSITQPGSSPNQMLFLYKFSPQSGKTHRIVSLDGSRDEYVSSVQHYSTDTNNFIVMAGKTNSPDFPIVNPIPPMSNRLNTGAQTEEYDGFITIFDQDLKMVFSTYIGGTGSDSIEDITIYNDNLFFAGNTNSPDLPQISQETINNEDMVPDGFWGVINLSNSYEYLFNSYMKASNIDVKSIKATSSKIIICGDTTTSESTFNPLIPETPIRGKDIFIQTYSYTENLSTFTPTPMSSVFFGGSNDEILEGSAIVSSNILCLAGNTNSNDISGPIVMRPEQIVNSSYPFLSIINIKDLDYPQLLGTYYIYGDKQDYITDIKSQSKDSEYFFISGYTNSNLNQFEWYSESLPYKPYSASPNGGLNTENYDAIVWELQWNVSQNVIVPVWGTLFGGSGNDTAISLGAANNAHICIAGITDSIDLPLQGCSPIAAKYLPSFYLAAFNIPGKIIYVNPGSAASPIDGSSWDKGFHTIQEAINNANNYDEIWVKKGNYNESLSINDLSDLIIYGGFKGTESNINTRNAWSNPTKISSISQTKGTINSGTSLLSVNNSLNISINGLIFEDGNNILGEGGGIYISNSNVKISDSQFYKNYSSGNGGAIFVDNSFLSLVNCVFSNNTCGGNGSAIFANESTLDITHCTFAHNLSAATVTEISTVYVQGTTSVLEILNSIIWAKEGISSVQVFYPVNIQYILLKNSIIQNISQLTTIPENVLDEDPLFSIPPTETDNGDLNLSSNSPAVNFGDPISLSIEYGSVTEDIQGEHRTSVGTRCKPDAGAFELPPPLSEITLIGGSVINLNKGDTFIEPGYEAIDGCGTNINYLVDIGSNVNTELPGEYTITYSVVCPYQGKTIEATRKVIVHGIIILGDANVILSCGDYYIDPGAIAFDSSGNDISNNISIRSDVDYSKPGNYYIEYYIKGSESISYLSPVRRNVTIQASPPILTLIGGQQITVPCGTAWSDPGYVVLDPCSGQVKVTVSDTVNTNATGTYTLTYSAEDSYGNQTSITRKVIVNCYIPKLEHCQNQCANDDAIIDEDGDGLTSCIENCMGTSDQKIDTDGDGMPDNFEITYNLNPLANDAKEDADLDGLLNIEEFLQNSKPNDSNSPWVAMYVSTTGNDDASGTLTSPWKTITNAIANTQNIKNCSIVLFPGDYYEDVTLLENTILIGITTNDANNRAVIHGQITGAEAAKIFSISIDSKTNVTNPTKADVSEYILLNCGNTSMHIKNVRFFGTGSEIGISVEGDKPYNTTIELCLFQDLKTGISIGDSIPIIRRCEFKTTTLTKSEDNSGVYIKDNSGSTNPSHSLGDVNDPNTGWNTFEMSSGKAIVNERNTEIKAQNNDWGTENEEEISELVTGDVDTQYYLGKGKALISSSLACVVWNATNRESILNATVTLTPQIYPPLTQNIDGVYTFPSIPDGNYTVNITAPNFTAKQIVTNIPQGELKSESVALTPANPEGEEPNEGEGSNEGGANEGSNEGSNEGEPVSKVKVPDVKNKTEAEARQIIASACLQVAEEIKEEECKEVEKGKVIRTEPPAGTEVDKGTEVLLVISKGTKRHFIISCGITNKPDNLYFSDYIVAGLLLGLLLIQSSQKNTSATKK